MTALPTKPVPPVIKILLAFMSSVNPITLPERPQFFTFFIRGGDGDGKIKTMSARHLPVLFWLLPLLAWLSPARASAHPTPYDFTQIDEAAIEAIETGKIPGAVILVGQGAHVL